MRRTTRLAGFLVVSFLGRFAAAAPGQGLPVVHVGATWHATFTGIPPVRRAQVSTECAPEWRPWPGEEVDIALGKPKGVAGQTLTIDASTLTVAPGMRSSQVTLSLELRSSRGTQHKIALQPIAKPLLPRGLGSLPSSMSHLLRRRVR